MVDRYERACPRCGRAAPMPVEFGAPPRCPHCGADPLVNTPFPAPAPFPPPVQKQGGSAVVWIVLAVAGLFFFVIMAAGVGVYLWMRNATASKGSAPGTGPAVTRPGRGPLVRAGADDAEIISWVGNMGASGCIVDANRDGAADVVGFGVLRDAGGTALLALEGRTGRLLWQQPVSDLGNVSLFCDGKTGVARYEDSALTLTALDAATGHGVGGIKLSDKLESIAFGPRCAEARTTDRNAFGLDLATGKSASCATTGRAVPRYRRTEEGPVSVGNVEVHVGASKGPGTPRVTVRATGGRSWETTLAELEGPSFGRSSPFVATRGGVVVASKKHGGRELVVVLLDLETGRVITKREERVDKADSHALKLSSTGASILMESFGMIHVYDAKTLAPLWWGGTMWAKGR
jgi:outer membrane protein assembly factor BamB